MKLLIAIVQDDDAKALMRVLTKEGLGVTKLASTGGFLHNGNTTLLIGIQDDDQEKALSLIKTSSSIRKIFMPAPASTLSDSMHVPVEITIGGATVFELETTNFYKF